MIVGYGVFRSGGDGCKSAVTAVMSAMSDPMSLARVSIADLHRFECDGSGQNQR